MKEAAKPAIVFYNSACPVCDAGIHSQQARMQGCPMQWVDVHSDPAAVQVVGAGLEQVRERLYVKDAVGRIHVGADALIELWSQTPGQQWMAQLLRLPVVHGIFVLAYNLFAKALYRWNRRRGHWQVAGETTE